MFFLAQVPLATLGRRRRPPGLLDGHNMILGHCGLVRYRVWSSGDALAGPGGPRRRLLDLNARRSDVERATRGADPVVNFFEKSPKSSIFKVLCLLWKFNWIYFE